MAVNVTLAAAMLDRAGQEERGSAMIMLGGNGGSG
jgi:hypothetical protein